MCRIMIVSSCTSNTNEYRLTKQDSLGSMVSGVHLSLFFSVHSAMQPALLLQNKLLVCLISIFPLLSLLLLYFALILQTVFILPVILADKQSVLGYEQERTSGVGQHARLSVSRLSGRTSKKVVLSIIRTLIGTLAYDDGKLTTAHKTGNKS